MKQARPVGIAGLLATFVAAPGNTYSNAYTTSLASRCRFQFGWTVPGGGISATPFWAPDALYGALVLTLAVFSTGWRQPLILSLSRPCHYGGSIAYLIYECHAQRCGRQTSALSCIVSQRLSFFDTSAAGMTRACYITAALRGTLAIIPQRQRRQRRPWRRWCVPLRGVTRDLPRITFCYAGFVMRNSGSVLAFK